MTDFDHGAGEWARPGAVRSARSLRPGLLLLAAVLASPRQGFTQATQTSEPRPLPKPERVQPPLDTALPDYKVRTDVEIAGTLKGVVAENTPSLVQAWAAAFRKRYPKASIDVPPPYGAEVADQKLLDGQVDFAQFSRDVPILAAQDFSVKYAYDELVIPVAGGSYRHKGFIDAMAVIVNKDNPLDKLTLAQLDAIYTKSRFRGYPRPIKEWGDLGLKGEWAEQPIRAWGLNLGQGMMEYMFKRITYGGIYAGRWTDDLLIEDSGDKIVRRVAADRFAMGYAGYGYLTPDVKPIALAETESGPYYAGTYEEVWHFDYPLARVMYLVANKPPGKPLSDTLTEFIRFILSKQGQQVVLDHAVFLPLRAAQVQKSNALLQAETVPLQRPGGIDPK